MEDIFHPKELDGDFSPFAYCILPDVLTATPPEDFFPPPLPPNPFTSWLYSSFNLDALSVYC